MSETQPELPVLDPASCRERQQTLSAWLAERDLDAAFLSHRHYVHALTGYWHPSDLTAVGLLLGADGMATLCVPGDPIDAPAADHCLGYVPHHLFTMVENVPGAMSETFSDAFDSLTRVATDRSAVPWQAPGLTWIDLSKDYQYLRRSKHPDEIAMLLHAQRGSDAAYAEARRLLEPGADEVEIYAAMHAAATRAIGEPLSGWGNDFQSGSPGGPPRRRAAEAGELAIYDIGVGYRGYRTDQSRAFSVDGKPTEAQRAAHARCCEALDRVEARLRPGLSCRELFADLKEFLDGWEGASFFHHLGHGIGLDPHEVPRLNPHWDDILEEGDVIAVEPGLYRDNLRAGIRLEQNFRITADGCERLSNYPLDL